MVDNIIFDCDSTLTTLEGIDKLADMNEVWSEVSAMTRRAMDKTSVSLQDYEERLNLVTPTSEQLKELGDLYVANLSPDVKAVISILHEAGKKVFIVSAGLQPAVFNLARYLNIEYTRVYAVPIYFSNDGEYESFDKSSPLVGGGGKEKVIGDIAARYGSTAFIGDGMNDVEGAAEADLFIGYGGAVERKKVKEASKIYVRCSTFSPFIQLLLTEEEISNLDAKHEELIAKGREYLADFVVRK